MLVMKTRVSSMARRTPMLCGFVLEGSRKVLGMQDAESDARIRQSVSDMGGEFGTIATVPSPGEPHQRILLAGLGRKESLGRDTFRFVSGRIAQKAREMKLGEFSIVLPPDSVADQSLTASQIVEGCKMSLYRFEKFKSKKEDRPPRLCIVAPGSDEISKSIKTAEIISEGVIFAKSIANLPPNECPPAALADFARAVSKKSKTRCRIISKAELKKRGFGGITAVGQGSKNEPKLIILEYNGGPQGQKPTVLVGKAVTFDTGGISLKTGESINDMKFDKSGGCTVLGIVKAASELRLPVNIVGIIPAVENMPGGESYRPDDIIRLYSGKTTEILNTDAEGRLILADALSYGEKHYGPRAIIDFATLTGACVVALGNNVAGMVSNDDALAEKILESSESTAEKIWRLPLDNDYMDMIKSEVADMKNMGIGRAAGTVAAAAFLRNAINDTPWVHLDIAGVAWTQKATKEKPYNPKGATGFGVRLVLDYLQKIQRDA